MLEAEWKGKINFDKDLEKQKNEAFENLFEESLLENRSDFVCLFLENGLILSKFLDEDRLKRLYNNEAV